MRPNEIPQNFVHFYMVLLFQFVFCLSCVVLCTCSKQPFGITEEVITLADIDSFPESKVTFLFTFVLEKLSAYFRQKKENFFFLSIGSADGLADKAISYVLQQNHGFGIYVEPIAYNSKLLRNKIRRSEAFKRSLVIRAAVMDACPTSTISMERPIDSIVHNTSESHWKRFELGRVIKESDRSNSRPPLWEEEQVPCLTGRQVLLFARKYFQKRK